MCMNASQNIWLLSLFSQLNKLIEQWNIRCVRVFFFALAPSHSISLVLNAILVARTMWANTFNAVQCARCAWKSNCLCTILFADNGKILIWLLPFVFIWYFSAAIFRVPIYNNAECKYTHLSTRFSCAYFGCW